MNKHQKLLTIASIVVTSGLVIYHLVANHIIENRVQSLQSEIEEINSLTSVDELRKANIDKVLSVLNRFNADLPESTRLAIASEISDASMKYDNLDVDLICATITHESAFSWHPEVVSPAGALGLMQVMPETGEFLAKIEGLNWTSPEDILFDPVLNIRLGSRYLSSLIELYDIDGGLAAYNGGGKRARMWLAQNRAKGILYRETQNYVPAVLSLYQEFRN